MNMILRKHYRVIFSVLLLAVSFAQSASGEAKYKAVILEQKVISKEPGRYNGWPSVAKLPSGRLMAVYSGDRDWHVCPWGKVRMVYSDDSGKTWSEPKSIGNTPLDDRGGSILVTKKGTVMVSWNTSLAFADKNRPYYDARYAQYAQHADKLSPELRQRWSGSWSIRSEDGGDTWGEPIPIPFHTPHGPIQLQDGRILMVSGRGVAESHDDGVTWRMLSRFGPAYGRLSEVYPLERRDGEIVVLSRAEKMRQFGSSDGGKTWSEPFETNIVGYPPHMIELENRWIVAAYGRRSEPPLGQFASISVDGGKTWEVENEITLALADSHSGTEEELGYPPNWDFGYPASAVLDDGTIWTVYYHVDKDGEWPSIMATHWKLEINDSTDPDIGFRHADLHSSEFPSHGVMTHLKENFSAYSGGDIVGQVTGFDGIWKGGASWVGEIVPVTGYGAGTQALQVSSSSGGAAGRGSVAICPAAPEVPNSSLRLESEDKMYWSVDLLARTGDSGVALIMSDTSPGNAPQTGFRLVFDTSSKPVSFASSVREMEGVAESAMVDGSLKPTAGIWHRFEFEINQSSIPGQGTFSVFASTEQDPTRRAILIDERYSFTARQLPNLFIIPTLGKETSDGVMINNIVLQSGLPEFPENPLLKN